MFVCLNEKIDDFITDGFLKVECEFVRSFFGFKFDKKIKRLEFYNCFLLTEMPELSDCVNLTDFLVMSCPLVKELPFFDRCKHLRKVICVACDSLLSIPDLSNCQFFLG